jgi:hypothetical protein
VIGDACRAALRQVIENRIGVELFTDKLLQVTKTEVYSRAAKKPQLNHKQPADVVLDYEFTVLFRKLESKEPNALQFRSTYSLPLNEC